MSTPLIWLALDGVGHPADAPQGLPGGPLSGGPLLGGAASPWETDLPTLRPFVESGLALDATLGVPGLPQSATGQTCWLTGQDAVEAMHGHFGPQPGPTLRRLLDADSLPVRLAQTGGRAALLNVYPPGYFTAQERRPRHGCFAYSFLAAGWPLNPPGLPLLSPTLGLGYAAPWRPTGDLSDWQRQGEALAAVRDYDLLVFDAWFSDALGHEGRDPLPEGLLAAGTEYLRRLDALLEGLLHSGARVVLSSDHGNFENLSVKAHTLARVPFAALGVELGTPHTVLDGGRVLRKIYGL